MEMKGTRPVGKVTAPPPNRRSAWTLIFSATVFGGCGSAALRISSDAAVDGSHDVSAGSGGVAGAGVGGRGGAAGSIQTGGASGTTGSAGSPDAGHGLAGLGTVCATGTSCASGFCAGGVCCDSACDLLCEQCSPSGSCEMAPDDSRCGTIDCPSDTACSDYATSLTTNRCAERGACKTSSDCPFVPATFGTYCAGASMPLFCDGAGNCDQPATVSCGGDSACPVSPGLCCYNVSGSTPTTTCQASANGCTASPTQCDAIQIQCDDARDCPGGEVCCYACGLGFSYATVSCAAASACDPSANQSFHVIVCSTNSQCPSGQTCQAPNNSSVGPLPPGYKICGA
jgi:hypothetical protein